MVRLAMRTGLLQVCLTQEGLFKTWGEVEEVRESGGNKRKASRDNKQLSQDNLPKYQ